VPSGEKIESRVWEAVSGILKDPEQLRAGFDSLFELERGRVRGDAGGEARLWADKLAEVERKRSRYQEMAPSDLINFDKAVATQTRLARTASVVRRSCARRICSKRTPLVPWRVIGALPLE
jgi:hypothetical protein